MPHPDECVPSHQAPARDIRLLLHENEIELART